MQNTNSDKNTFRLYAVTDRKWTHNQTLYEQIESSLNGGVTCIQLREKGLAENEFLKEAIKIKALCHRYNVPLIINDNVYIALKSDADGVHLGQGDMSITKARKILGKDKIIGATCKTVNQAKNAENDGADYIGTGAMFPTSTKTDTFVVDKEEAKRICKSVSIPVVAIGGISKDNITTLKMIGFSGYALVSAIFAANNIEKECRELSSLI